MKLSHTPPIALTIALLLPCWGLARDPYGDAPPAEREQQRGAALGVARVSVTDGDVRLLRAASGDNVQAQAGMPLTARDSISTGESSRAEVQFDPGNFARLDENAEMRIGELGNRRYRVEVIRGSVVLSQFKGAEADVDIETSHAVVRPLKPGSYRVEFREVGRTDIAVRNGAAEVDSGRRTEKLGGGKSMVLRGDPADVNVRIGKAEPRDAFDDWNKRRDKLLNEDRGRSVWAPSYLGFGYGWPYGYYGYGGFFGPRYYGSRVRTAVFVGGGSRHGHSRSRR